MKNLISLIVKKIAGFFSNIVSFGRSMMRRGEEDEQQEIESFNSMKRNCKNPIMYPDPAVNWRSWQTFNPAAVFLNGKTHLIYRAIGDDGISRFGYAGSSDNVTIDEVDDSPAYKEMDESSVYTYYSQHSGGSFAGCEDPRIISMKGENTLYLTFTSCASGLRVGLSSISVADFLGRRWNKWKKTKCISPCGEVHKNWVIFPERIKGKYAICHSINPITVEYLDDLDFENGMCIKSSYKPGKPSKSWDSYMRGAGPPPLKTDEGWLLFYHAMNHKDMSNYRIGAMLLDLEDPTKVLYRSQKPVLMPEDLCEKEGYKGGVVYATGSVIKDGELFLYYGGADSVICVASADLKEFLDELKEGVTKPVALKKAKSRKVLPQFRLHV